LVEGVRVLAREVPPAPVDELRTMADALRSKLGSGVVVIGARDDASVNLIAAVSKDLTARVRAGELVKRVSALVGGGGGGRAGCGAGGRTGAGQAAGGFGGGAGGGEGTAGEVSALTALRGREAASWGHGLRRPAGELAVRWPHEAASRAAAVVIQGSP